jgi:hypothetical protein
MPQTDLTAAVAKMDEHARGLAAAFRAWRTAQRNGVASRQLAQDLANHLTQLGLGEVVADASIARAAAGASATPDAFLKRWGA